MAYRLFGGFWQARHPPRYAAFLRPSSPSFPHSSAIRAGTVAVGRAGRIVASRGYTWGEGGYPIPQPATLFRIASLSKAFAAAAVARLVASGALSWNTRAFPFLGISTPAPADPAINC